MAQKRTRPQRRRTAIVQTVPGYKYPVCYLTHRGHLDGQDLVEIVYTALMAAGAENRADQWENQASKISTCDDEEGNGRGAEGMQKLLLLAHKFVDIR
jgi:hypothetical protein